MVDGTGSLDAHDAATAPGVLQEALSVLRPLAAGTGDIGGLLSEVSDRALIGMLDACRQLRAVSAAIEARVQVAFDDSQRAAAQQRGVPKKDQGKGVADQIALARGVSVYRAANDLALVKGLVAELPATMSRLASAATSEGAALAVARETVCLMPDDRAAVDQRVAGRLSTRTSAKRALGMARAEAARVDAESVVRRIRMAENERCVTVRPAPDAMVYLSALMPVKDGIAAYAALDKHATTARAAGDARSRGQIMADELLARLTGVSSAPLVPVEVQLVMPAQTLLGRSSAGEEPDAARPIDPGNEPGRLGDQVIPAELCRQIALIPDDAAQRWIRRVFTDPASGQVRQVDERRRLFTGAIRRAILLRDQGCRSCGAPIREVDHVTPHSAGGPTTMASGQGLCQRCNLTKQLPGWTATAFEVEGSHVVLTRTPTGNRYLSEAPTALPASHQASEPESESDVAIAPSGEERRRRRRGISVEHRLHEGIARRARDDLPPIDPAVDLSWRRYERQRE